MEAPEPALPFTPNRRFILRMLCLGAVITTLVWGGLHLLWEYRYGQQLDQLAQALGRRDLTQADFLLRALASRHPDDPELWAQQARFEGLVYDPRALATWLAVVEKLPENPEYRVAAVLAALQAQKFKTAQELIRQWPGSSQNGTAYHRAAMALAFAREDWTGALPHADFLLKADPASLTARLNQAIIALHGPVAKAEAARATLRELIHPPETRFPAYRALLQDALAARNQTTLLDLTGPLLTGSTGKEDAPLLLLVLETLEKSGPRPDARTVQEVWMKTLTDRATLSRLAGWMVTTGRGTAAWDLLQAHPPFDHWSFPTGLAFTEAAIVSKEQERAWKELTQSTWPGLEDVRAFCLSRLSWPSASAKAQLETAVVSATRRPDGLRHLLSIAESWRWEPGLVRILQERILSRDPEPREFQVLFAFLEKRKDTEGMRQAAVRHLELHPRHPVALNEAAYFSLLRGQDLPQATLWAKDAVGLRPDQEEFAATLALAYVVQKDYASARPLLDRFPQAKSMHLPRALWLQGQQKELPPTLRQQLSRIPFVYSEETGLQKKALGLQQP